ncbi:MAG: aminotransferase class I/II-fold pyridoxal phosphate-dependent enzyme [Candidatus Dormibacteria bacterium]|jgi:dTDP-4-amino-4,6-dideoxygalactose transaminase
MTGRKALTSDLAVFGGPVTFDPPKSTGTLATPDPEKVLRYSRIFYDRRWYTNAGPVNQMLEARLAEWHGTAHCVTFSGGFWAVSLAIRQLALPGRREVVTPSLTYRRMGEIIASAGMIPRYCDVDPETLAQTAETTRVCVNDSTALILGVHPAVDCCDAAGLERLASSTGVPLLFDSVESAYETSQGRRVGTFGRAEGFSLHATKLVNGFEGGYIVTDDEELADSLKLMRAFGIPEQDRIASFGMNAKLNEVHAAAAMASLDDLPALIERNRRLYVAYCELLSGIPGLTLRRLDERELTPYKNILVRVGEAWPLSRDDTVGVLRAEGALARAFYSPALHTQTTYFETRSDPLPVAERVSREYVLLPCGDQVSVADAAAVVDLLRFICEHGEEIHARLLDRDAQGGHTSADAGRPERPRPSGKVA